MKKGFLLVIAAGIFAGCHSDPDTPGPVPVREPVIDPGVYNVQIRDEYTAPMGPDGPIGHSTDTTYTGHMTISGGPDTICVVLENNGMASRSLAYMGTTNDTVLYQQPYPGLPNSWVLHYDVVSGKMIYVVTQRSNHQGEWQTTVTSL